MEIGIIGIGRWGKKVIGEYLALANQGIIDSVCVYDSDSTRMAEFKGMAKVKVCDSLDDMLNQVTGVHICLPNNMHYPVASEALEKGVHVLVEKPFALDTDAAHSLIRLAMEHGLILQTGHIYRFSNAVKKLREMYLQKEFGELHNVNFYWTHLMPYFEGTDIIWDLLPHPVDIFNCITGSWPFEFTGTGKAFRRKSPNEVVSLQSSSGINALLSFHFSWLSPIRRRQMEIIGSKRSALVEMVDQKITLYNLDGTSESVAVEQNNTIHDEILNFVDCIKTGKNLQNNAAVGAKVIEVIEEAIRCTR